MKKLSIGVLVLCFLFQGAIGFADTAVKKVTIHFFEGNRCPHCKKEKKFLEQLAAKYPYIEVQDHEIYKSIENSKMLDKMSKKLNFHSPGVPVTIINTKFFIGFDENTTGKEIEAAVIEAHQNMEESNSPKIEKTESSKEVKTEVEMKK